MRATTPTTPTSYRSFGPGSSFSGSRAATIASMRLAPSTSLTSLIERSWPTASGVSVSGKVTVSRRGRTGSASGSGSLARIASSASSGDSTTSRTGLPSTASVPLDRHAARGLGRVAERQVDPQHAVLVGRRGAVCVDVYLQLDDTAKGAGLDLHLLIDAAFGLLHVALADDRDLPAADLDPDLVQLHSRQVHLHHGPLRVAAVVDVHIGSESPAPAADVRGPCPRIEVSLRHGPEH